MLEAVLRGGPKQWALLVHEDISAATGPYERCALAYFTAPRRETQRIADGAVGTHSEVLALVVWWCVSHPIGKREVAMAVFAATALTVTAVANLRLVAPILAVFERLIALGMMSRRAWKSNPFRPPPLAL